MHTRELNKNDGKFERPLGISVHLMDKSLRFKIDHSCSCKFKFSVSAPPISQGGYATDESFSGGAI